MTVTSGKHRKNPHPRKRPSNGEQNKEDVPGLPARECATRILTQILDNKRGLDGLIDPEHGLREFLKLEQADRALVRAIVTTALRNKGTLDLVLGRMVNRPLPKGARHLAHTLLAAAAQILHLDVPDSAAVNLAVTSISRDPRSVRFKNLANAILRRLSREKDTLDLPDGEGLNAAKLSMPGWFFERLRKSYGRNKSVAIANAHRLEPNLDLSVKSNPGKWAEECGGHIMFNGSIRLTQTGPLSELPGYHEGEWWVQDIAATLPAKLLGAVQGCNVLDLCAAPGGKTAQLIAAGADVTAVEKSADRLGRLETNLARLSMKAVCIQADILEWRPETLFSHVMLDAPCSSTGTARRHPDVLWTKKPEDITALAALQEKLLRRAASFVKPDGLLVFANCSIDRSEGEELFAKVSTSLDGFRPEPVQSEELFGRADLITRQGTIRTLPSQPAPLADGAKPPDPRLTGMDGFFAARFRRVES